MERLLCEGPDGVKTVEKGKKKLIGTFTVSF